MSHLPLDDLFKIWRSSYYENNNLRPAYLLSYHYDYRSSIMPSTLAPVEPHRRWFTGLHWSLSLFPLLNAWPLHSKNRFGAHFKAQGPVVLPSTQYLWWLRMFCQNPNAKRVVWVLSPWPEPWIMGSVQIRPREMFRFSLFRGANVRSLQL